MGKRRVKVGDPRVCVAYMRVSTDEQKLGPAAQRSTIETWAAREGKTVTAWCLDEGVSGATEVDARPGLLSALEAVRVQGAGVLVIAKRDRIARDMLVAVSIERIVAGAGAQLLSADGTGNGEEPADQFMRRVLDGASEYERALIRARTKAALAAKKRAGGRVGMCPFGFRDDGTGNLVADEREQRTIKAVLSLRAAGFTQRAIAERLRASSFVSRSGKPLGQVQIHRILHGAAGELAAPKELAPRETTQAFGQTLVKAPKRRFERNGEPFNAAPKIDALKGKGYSPEQIATALSKLGVTWAGRPVAARDL